MTAILEVFSSAFGTVQQALFEAVVQPALFSLGFANFLDDGFDATGWLLVGLLQLAALVTVIGPLQRWRPVEAVTDRATVRLAHAIALAHGGSDAGLPGLRPHYHAHYYGAYFRDPDGNKFCVACHRDEPQEAP